ncbi:MAG: ribonuclease P protein component [Patescibacteria group bacterium]|jgi:ribonuclease P protein component
MLKKINRISRNKEFDRVFKTGQSFYGRVLGIKAAKNDLAESRFGILINTKVSKKAVVRNRIRRQIRAIIRLQLDKLPTGLDIVIIVFPLILDKEYTEIGQIIDSGFKSLGLYKKR